MKFQRQAKILELIDRFEIETQEELTDHLRAVGYSTTQATVSRDIKELRLIKSLSTETGKYKYTAAAAGAADSFTTRLRNIFRECVTDIDAAQNMVVIKTLPGLGQAAAMAIDAMRAGADVLLEKPMSVTLEEAIEMMRVEKETGKILSIGFQPRFSKNMQQIKKIVDSGVLGKIYYIQTGGGRRRGIPLRADGNTFIRRETAGIGALGDIGCYSLDMVLHAIGYPRPLSVDGCVSDYFGKSEEYYGKECASLFGVDDFGAAFIRLEGGVVLDFRIAWAMNIDSPGDTILLGTRGGLRIPATDCWNGSIGGPMTLYTEIAGQQVETKLPMFEEDPYSFFEQKIRSFLDAVKTRGPAPVPTSEIIYNQAIIDGVSRSAAAGHAVTIEVPGV